MDIHYTSTQDIFKSSILLFLSSIFFLCSIVEVQSKDFPADSLLCDKRVPLYIKTIVVPIAAWQRISFSTSLLNCQFEPCCSQFMAQSIAHHGIFKGMIIGADRIVRCNPFAHIYHVRYNPSCFYADGKLFDPVPVENQFKKPNLNLLLYTIPGLYRTCNNRIGDGVFSFLLITSPAINAYRMHINGRPVGASIFGSIAVLFWLADIYNATKINTP